MVKLEASPRRGRSAREVRLRSIHYAQWYGRALGAAEADALFAWHAEAGRDLCAASMLTHDDSAAENDRMLNLLATFSIRSPAC